jgi:hypothetical protein
MARACDRLFRETDRRNITQAHIFSPAIDVEHHMIRLQLSLAFLLISTLAHAQNQTAAATPPGVATEGDGWLWLLVIPFVVVAAGVYLFIKKSRAPRL